MNSDSSQKAQILEFKAQRGEELRKRYGAHGIGIGRRTINGSKTNDLALVFYVESKSSEPATKIPDSFTFQPSGTHEMIRIMTQIVETPRATLESESPDDSEK